ncbi:YbaB/EbfC family nucleoid-associated protein [Actinophytocola sp.]|uniref:YbaB/EbfC family nucleoid-associated protein n=1 Tax=Actinophytocola sp. TaxID=1872138 RepID=UPI002D7E74B4|nr:YbaB/EbfC family nucleoid-associated protein [Actinophytocola sp.]HET9143019.1 YbaB/EbfC family nucleoid-associated protein [Actinophytocola sp.]HEU5110404.1 YbaB/EbfC family nucleoid-associated protein [Micromonosporaceae bacterium]
MADWERQVSENAQRYRDLTTRLASLSITESSGDGAVKVTVSATGLLTDLVLRDRWHPEPLADVAAEIMACLRRAQARIPDLLRDTMFDVVGPDDPGTHLLLQDARERFPEPPEQQPRKARTPERDRDTTGDWDERDVLEDV